MSVNTDVVLIRQLTPRNFLSFGPDNPGIELRPLNVLIGPNGCGKSKLIEAVNFMRSAPKELRDVTREGGGVTEWIWKGQPRQAASVDIVTSYPFVPIPLRHVVSFCSMAGTFSLEDERVEEIERRDPDERDVFFYYRYQNGIPVINTTVHKKQV